MTDSIKQQLNTDFDMVAGDRSPRFLTETGKRSARTAILGQLTDLAYIDAPMTEGLIRAAIDSPNKRVQGVLLSIRMWLLAGYPLSTALSKQRELFPPYCIEMVRSGEESGRLYETLSDLEGVIEEDIKFRSDFVGYSTYIFAVLTAQSLIAGMVLVFVVPSFAKIFSDMGGKLPGSTQLLIKISDLTAPLWPIVFLFMAACLFLGPDRVAKKLRVYRLIMKFPGLSRIVREKELAHVSVILGRLLNAGYPVNEGLRYVSTLKMESGLSGALYRAQVKTEYGAPLAEALKEEGKWFPSSLISVMNLGEQSGQSGKFLSSLAIRYRRHALNRARIALYIGSSLAIIATGLVSMFVYISLMMPIMNLSSLVGG